MVLVTGLLVRGHAPEAHLPKYPIAKPIAPPISMPITIFIMLNYTPKWSSRKEVLATSAEADLL